MQCVRKELVYRIVDALYCGNTAFDYTPEQVETMKQQLQKIQPDNWLFLPGIDKQMALDTICFKGYWSTELADTRQE